MTLPENVSQKIWAKSVSWLVCCDFLYCVKCPRWYTNIPLCSKSLFYNFEFLGRRLWEKQIISTKISIYRFLGAHKQTTVNQTENHHPTAHFASLKYKKLCTTWSGTKLSWMVLVLQNSQPGQKVPWLSEKYLRTTMLFYDQLKVV